MQKVREAFVTMPDGMIVPVLMEVTQDEIADEVNRAIKTDNCSRRIGFALNKGKKSRHNAKERRHAWKNETMRVARHKEYVESL